MRYVVTVARERNFTRAAEQLHFAQRALASKCAQWRRCSAFSSSTAQRAP